MTKEFEMDDDTVQNQCRQPQEQSGDKPRQHRVEGKALRVNENSVEDRDPSALPASPDQRSGDLLKPHKVEGKALRVNKNSVDDQEPARSPVPPHRE
ncbi:hypothetical protein [Mesorhizobium waimense]|uniref:hypothetical protein n=1 Tax=Mesorhizobium waimense TaxID=1300307 RepID=UPI001FDF517C|nr:hypothetical protein [Mesorhizobium waimense]